MRLFIFLWRNRPNYVNLNNGIVTDLLCDALGEGIRFACSGPMISRILIGCAGNTSLSPHYFILLEVCNK